MKKRSLGKICLYFLFTVGLYELLWFAETRKEMIARGAQIPDMFVMSTAYIARLLAFALLGFLIVSWFHLDNGKTSVISPACWSEYVIGTAAETSATHPISAACKAQVAASNSYRIQQDRENKAIVLALVGGFYYLLASRKWLTRYSEGVEKATGGAIKGLNVALILALTPIGIDMLILQDKFNRL